MNKKEIFKKFLIVIFIVAFSGVGFFSVNQVTSRPANAACCACICIGGGVSPGLSAIGAITISSIEAAKDAAIALLIAESIRDLAEILLKITEVRTHLVQWFFTFWTKNLQPALMDMGEQMVVLDADQSRAISSLLDASNFMRLIMSYENQRLQAHREQRISDNTIVMGTVAGGMGRAQAFRRAYNSSAPLENTNRSANHVLAESATGIAEDLKNRWEIYTERYCRKDDNNEASGCTTDRRWAGQDIDVVGTIFSRDTIDFTNEDTKKTVDHLTANIAEPFINDPVSAGLLNTFSGQGSILKRESYKAKRQVIYDALYHVAARRAPGSDMWDFTEPLRAQAGIEDAVISTDPSYNEVMHVMVNERLRSGKYSLEQIEEPEVNSRELVIQQALYLMQLNDQLELMDRYSIILAAQIGESIREAKRKGAIVIGAPRR